MRRIFGKVIELPDKYNDYIQPRAVRGLRKPPAYAASAGITCYTKLEIEMGNEVIDRKFQILAVNPCKKGAVYTENEGMFFAAKDKALPAALRAYWAECAKLGCGREHLDSIHLLIERVKNFQEQNGGKTPDTETDCEIDRCIGGVGV